MKERIKRWLTLFLTMIMVCTLMPASMFAAEETKGTEETYETSETEAEEESEVYVYEYSDNDISVTVTLDDAGDLPDEAELVAEEAEVTDEYLEEINATREEQYDEYCENIWANNPQTVLFKYEEITADVEKLLKLDPTNTPVCIRGQLRQVWNYRILISHLRRRKPHRNRE